MHCGWVLLALAAAACGDNLSLPRTHDLVIVAHQDDDLLFMQPDLWNVVHQHDPVTIVYVTAGDAGAGLDYAVSRIVAVKAAYGWVAGSQDWRCRWIDLAGHPAHRCDLDAAPVSLVFLGYPDGGIRGDRPDSLLHLFEGAIEHADTVAVHVARYDRPGLVATLTELITSLQPSIIRTLEVSAVHGDDHSDHMLVGALTVLAAARARSDAALMSYRGYNVNGEPPNLPEVIFQQVSLGMRAYSACQTGCATCVDEVCAPENILAWYNGFLHRHYAVAMRRPPMAGTLQIDSRCLAVTGGSVALDDCSRATELEFEPGGVIRAGDRCLRLLDGRLTAGPCGDGVDGYFLFDDEGHLWAGVAAAPGPAMLTDHTVCLFGDGDGVRAGVCGAQRDPRWVLGRPPATTPRVALGITASGRALQLADLTADGKADLCRIEGSGLWCAVGDGTGRFDGSVRIDAPEHPLAIDPDSLMLGDLDGDGRVDACGRTPSGILCALAAHGYAAELWSPAFGSLDAADAGRPLAIVDRKVCGMMRGGAACAGPGARAQLRSPWPASALALWPADLDGDGAADWCTATDAGPACGLEADRAFTSEGMPWGFANRAAVEGSVATDGTIADQTHGAVADISGDGRADLCVAVGSAVECAVSQGHSFGPRFPVVTLAPGTQIQALWLGDLDGDGKADPCVDDGASITCGLSP